MVLVEEGETVLGEGEVEEEEAKEEEVVTVWVITTISG
jgi:hypothetical protein